MVQSTEQTASLYDLAKHSGLTQWVKFAMALALHYPGSLPKVMMPYLLHQNKRNCWIIGPHEQKPNKSSLSNCSKISRSETTPEEIQRKGVTISMNILHMKYAVEVARVGSINKAAERLYIAQPNLSRCIKELETDLGIVIFDRTFKGMTLTAEGEEFICHAQKVLNQIDDIERMYKNGIPAKQRFSISVPRASYISDAFARFTKSIDASPAEIYYMETNPLKAVNNILNADYRLGIIRYAANYDKYFKNMLEEKGLAYEVIAEFKYVLIMSRECVLTSKPDITFADLRSLIEIAHGDPYVPSLPVVTIKKAELPEDIERRIFLFERGSQFDLLVENPETFMWVSPLPPKLLDRYGIAQRECVDNTKIYKDVLIRRKDYALSELDKRFIAELRSSKQRYL